MALPHSTYDYRSTGQRGALTDAELIATIEDIYVEAKPRVGQSGRPSSTVNGLSD
jgi:hypothetical protein